MNAAVVGIIGSLLGVALGLGYQYVQHRIERQEALKDIKRKAYVGYLRAVDASYTQAYEKGVPDRPEDREIRMAAAEIELLARQEIYRMVRGHSSDVIKAHNMVAKIGARLRKLGLRFWDPKLGTRLTKLLRSDGRSFSISRVILGSRMILGLSSDSRVLRRY